MRKLTLTESQRFLLYLAIIIQANVLIFAEMYYDSPLIGIILPVELMLMLKYKPPLPQDKRLCFALKLIIATTILPLSLYYLYDSLAPEYRYLLSHLIQRW